MRIARALHRLALLAYPRRFRHEFAAELERTFAARAARVASRPAASAAVMLLEIADAIASGLAERLHPTSQAVRPPSKRSQFMTWESIRGDIRLALRQCRRAPLFAALTVASLALGIGVNSAMFGVVEAVLLRPLPYSQPSSLVMVWSDNTKAGEQSNPVSPADFEAFRTAPSLASVEAMYSFLTPLQIRLGPEPEPALASQVTPGMFALLGRGAFIGRIYDDASSLQGAIVSHQFWQRRLGSDPNATSRALVISGTPEPIPIVGVMPADFTFPYGSMLASTGFTRGLTVDLWLPLSPRRDPRLLDASGQPNRTIHYLGVIARMRQGATLDRVRNELASIAISRASQYPDTNAGWGTTVRPLHEQTVGPIRTALLTLLAGVGIVLLITCINVANVLLARAAGRGRDLAIRSALGASRRRLIQQMLTESVLLSLAGGVAGIGIMLLATRGILAVAPSNLPRLDEVSPGTPVVLFSLVLSIITGIAVGLLPAFAAANSQAQDALRDGTRTTTSRARRRTRSVLIVAEIALAMALTVCGGLLLRSFVSVLNVDPGFSPGHLLTFQMAVPARYREPQSTLAFYDDLEARLKALPGAVGVGGTTRLPLGSTNVTTFLEVEGRAVAPAERPEVEMRRAVFDYFSTMGIPLLRGRGFTRDDHLEAPRAAVVNAALAARVFPNEDPVGKRVRFGDAWLTIVGVVGNVRHASLEEVPKPEIYITYRQGPPGFPFVVVRTHGNPSELSASVRQVARDLNADPPTDLRPMEAIRQGSVSARRFVLLLVGGFGVFALALAALGVFGVITLIAAERTAEVGIRLALGATPAQVMRLIVTQALHLAIAGVAIGGAAALAFGPVLKTQLFGVAATDPITFAGVAVVLVLTAAAAAILPARRAMRVDPAHALRN